MSQGQGSGKDPQKIMGEGRGFAIQAPGTGLASTTIPEIQTEDSNLCRWRRNKFKGQRAWPTPRAGDDGEHLKRAGPGDWGPTGHPISSLRLEALLLDPGLTQEQGPTVGKEVEREPGSLCLSFS